VQDYGGGVAPARVVLIAVLAIPAAATVRDPGTAGRYAVGITTQTFVDASRGRTLVTEVWYPAAVAGRDVPPHGGRFPLVLVAHGFCGFRTNYEYLTLALAARGFVVAAPDFPGFNKAVCDAGGPETGLFAEPPADLEFLRAALHEQAGAAGELARHLRERRAGLVGHSLGGAAVVNAATDSPRFPAFAALPPPHAVMVMGGTADRTLPPATFADPFYMALPPPAFLVTIVGGTHSGFTDVDSGLTPATLARQQSLVGRYVVAFFKRYLRRDHRFDRFLTPVDAAAQGADVTLDARPR